MQGRQPYIRMATPRTIPRNEDLAIVTVSPIGEMPFSELRLVILNLLVDRFGLQVCDLQKCPFDRGQGFVRLVRVTDRDSHSLPQPPPLSGSHFRC